MRRRWVPQQRGRQELPALPIFHESAHIPGTSATRKPPSTAETVSALPPSGLLWSRWSHPPHSSPSSDPVSPDRIASTQRVSQTPKGRIPDRRSWFRRAIQVALHRGTIRDAVIELVWALPPSSLAVAVPSCYRTRKWLGIFRWWKSGCPDGYQRSMTWRQLGQWWPWLGWTE